MTKRLSILPVIFILYLMALNTLAFGQTLKTGSHELQRQNTIIRKSEVKLVNNVPKIIINGKELNTVIANVYYIFSPAPQGIPFQPKYGSEKWVNRVKSVIDEASITGVKAIMLNVFWGDLDRSLSRPNNIGQNLDFSSLDNVMDYASQKNVYVILVNILYPAFPEWWVRENNLPPFNKYGICDFVETDSYGNIYNNPSMNNDKVHQDYGRFIQAVIKRYKNHPALLGWNVGVGATGEDNYGPNYIDLMMGMVGGKKGERKPLMFTDYSPFFQKRFKEWITKKYKTDRPLQQAWGDNSVTLARLAIPKPDEMIVNAREWLQSNRMDMFPDPSDGWFETDKKVLTKKGLDFYEFRNYMRSADREYYSNLFKKNDPDHILLFVGFAFNSEIVNSPSLCDGITSNPNLYFDGPLNPMNPQARDFYYHMISAVKNAVKHNKLVIITGENRSSVTGFGPASSVPFPGFTAPGRLDGGRPPARWDSETQIRYIETFGKAVKCANGMFAYVVDLLDKDAPSKWIPSWFSHEAKAAARRVADYVPTKNCDCSLVRDLYLSNSCGSINAPPGCGLLEKAYRSFCSGENIK